MKQYKEILERRESFSIDSFELDQNENLEITYFFEDDSDDESKVMLIDREDWIKAGIKATVIADEFDEYIEIELPTFEGSEKVMVTPTEWMNEYISPIDFRIELIALYAVGPLVVTSFDPDEVVSIQKHVSKRMGKFRAPNIIATQNRTTTLAIQLNKFNYHYDIGNTFQSDWQENHRLFQLISNGLATCSDRELNIIKDMLTENTKSLVCSRFNRFFKGRVSRYQQFLGFSAPIFEAKQVSV